MLEYDIGKVSLVAEGRRHNGAKAPLKSQRNSGIQSSLIPVKILRAPSAVTTDVTV